MLATVCPDAPAGGCIVVTLGSFHYLSFLSSFPSPLKYDNVSNDCAQVSPSPAPPVHLCLSHPSVNLGQAQSLTLAPTSSVLHEISQWVLWVALHPPPPGPEHPCPLAQDGPLMELNGSCPWQMFYCGYLCRFGVAVGAVAS